MKTIKMLLVSVLLVVFITQGQSLTIRRDYLGGTPPTNSIGNGTLTNTFDLACKVWELAIRDEYLVTLHFGWAPVGAGQHTLNAQGGNPHRETEGTVLFNNDNVVGHAVWFIDPDPLYIDTLEYIEADADLGLIINASRYYRWSLSGEGSAQDLFTAALHEIGHALGLSFGNLRFNTESIDRDIDVTSGPFAGIEVPLQTNVFGVVSHLGYVAERPLMTGSYAPGERVMPSILDIIVLGELSQFKKLNLSLSPVLEIKVFAMENQLKGEFSWIQPLPSPLHRPYKLQKCIDLQQGNWVDTETEIVFKEGVYVAEMVLDTPSSFLRLQVK